MKIAVGASSFGAEDILLKRGFVVKENPFKRKLTALETVEHIKDCDGLLAGLEPLNESTLKDAKKLRAIARIGIGMDNVDEKYCHEHGIAVSNTPDAPTEAVAEMCLTVLLSISRRLNEANADVHKGIWKKRIGFSLRGKNVLFIGYGRIARKFRALLEPFGCVFTIYDPNIPDLSVKSLMEGVENADIITLHANAAHEILNADCLSRMSRRAVILNSARGNLVDEEALYECLKDGAAAYYWGDVFKTEPYEGKLTECENAILTPHISTYTDRCRAGMEAQAVANILRDLKC